MIEKLYTVEEVAELASVTGRTIRNYLKSGRLIGRKIGGQWRFPEAEVQRLLTGAPPEEETAPATETPPYENPATPEPTAAMETAGTGASVAPASTLPDNTISYNGFAAKTDAPAFAPRAEEAASPADETPGWNGDAAESDFVSPLPASAPVSGIAEAGAPPQPDYGLAAGPLSPTAPQQAVTSASSFGLAGNTPAAQQPEPFYPVQPQRMEEPTADHLAAPAAFTYPQNAVAASPPEAQPAWPYPPMEQSPAPAPTYPGSTASVQANSAPPANEYPGGIYAQAPVSVPSSPYYIQPAHPSGAPPYFPASNAAASRTTGAPLTSMYQPTGHGQVQNVNGQPLPYAPGGGQVPQAHTASAYPDAAPAYAAPSPSGGVPAYPAAPSPRFDAAGYPVYPSPAQIPPAYPPSPSGGGYYGLQQPANNADAAPELPNAADAAVPQAPAPKEADAPAAPPVAEENPAEPADVAATESTPDAKPADATAKTPDLSDVGKLVTKFISEVHDCSQGPQLCAVIDAYQSLSSAKLTSERLNNIADEESEESGQLCQAFVEFDERFYVTRYTLFGSSSFLLRCLKLIG